MSRKRNWMFADDMNKGDLAFFLGDGPYIVGKNDTEHGWIDFHDITTGRWEGGTSYVPGDRDWYSLIKAPRFHKPMFPGSRDEILARCHD